MKEFEDYSFKSGDEYANMLINNMHLSDELFEELPENLMLYWEEGIRQLCIERYDLYIKGKVDDYRLFEKDMISLYKEATMKATEDIVADLVDRGEITMAINDKGEIVYGSNDWDAIKEKKTRRRKKQ